MRLRRGHEWGGKYRRMPKTQPNQFVALAQEINVLGFG
jgi:hypothetical protein